jgi:DNA-binding transcriptional regulator YiaG
MDPSTSAIMADEHREMDEVESRIDRQKAIAEFDRRFSKQKEPPMQLATRIRFSVIDPNLKVVPHQERVKPPKAEPVNQPGAEGIELNEIRKELGYSVPEFAKVLNLSKGTFSSYIYGVVKNVPASVMKEARMLQRQAGVEFKAINKKFGKLAMYEIVDRWIKDLGIESDDKGRDTQLAEVLGVDRATVWRWRERDMRPETRKLKEYDDLVQKAIKKAQKAALRKAAQSALF